MAEFCDNCGKTIPREDSIRGCGNVDDGYYCSECYGKDCD